jgi:hypothetical protein
MTFADAKQILNGSHTAATDYFKGTTTDKLITAFRPEAENAMNDVGVTKPYKELVGHFNAIPFAKSDLVDIDRYVVGDALRASSSCWPRRNEKPRRILQPESPIS